MKTRDLSLIALFASLTAVGAFFSIPFVPVPISLQSLISLLAGVLLGARKGALSQVIYVLLGCAGLPVFAGGAAGIGYLFGPTGGYLLGFIFAAYGAGVLAGERPYEKLYRTGIAMVVGTAIIYSCGLLSLIAITHLDLTAALYCGFLPFIPGDVIKIVAALVIVQAMGPVLERNSGKTQAIHT